MKRGRVKVPQEKRKSRIQFFDILRIICIVVIVYVHYQFNLIPWFNAVFFPDGYLPFNIYTIGLEGWAVFGLIFISGAVLEYNYQRIEGYPEYSKFLFRRAIRIYPAFWMSLVFGLFLDILLSGSLAGRIIENNWFFILFEYTGFYVILGKGSGFINQMGWFVAAIISLYILFPYLSKIVRKYQLKALLALCAISFFTRSLSFSYNGILPDMFWRWFPICNLFEFCLGIYIIQNSFYPKNEKEYPIVHELAELSFYIFLFHVIIIQTFTLPGGLSAQFSALLGNSYIILYVTIEVTIIVISSIAMIIDRKIQQKIRQNEKIKIFLQS